eukprot:CAMPEP_0183591246 /NCGR_PEP_ID=MMETSP0371-20130417/165903_1 /TAXON_ID=268820 /ORGANISM="Peridinium aciculiferum, Strain PAER-2" /LENGTH=57 /DNA_ID=CAMNT_0025802713 /DNA_START=50 /DNA_END=223 /DNA_ORIENTATION=-
MGAGQPASSPELPKPRRQFPDRALLGLSPQIAGEMEERRSLLERNALVQRVLGVAAE